MRHAIRARAPRATTLVVSLLALVLAVTAATALAADAHAQDLGIRVGTKPPAAVIETLEGGTADLSQWIGREPVLIEFWATWCGNCRQLEPTLRAAFDRYKDRMRFLGVAVSVNQSRERVRRHLAEHGMPLHEMLYDRTGDASEAFETPATSYVVVLDKSGTVVYTGLGGRQNLDEAIAKALATP